jgi:hypothetical protein
VKEEVKIKYSDKHVSRSRDAHSSVVLNGNGTIARNENHKEVQKPIKKIETAQKENKPAEGTKLLVEESSESEVDVKAKESDSDIEVTVIEDDIDLEDLMRQKVRSRTVEIIMSSLCCCVILHIKCVHLCTS